MSYLVIDNDGQLHHRRTQTPNSAAIRGEVGDPGWDMVRLGGPQQRESRAMGWVNDCGHLDGLPRNVVGSCLLISLGANYLPYAGPVVITGWHQYHEIVALDGEQADAMRVMYADIRVVLGLDAGELSDLAPPNWVRAMGRAAEMVGSAPTPTATFSSCDDLGWPL